MESLLITALLQVVKKCDLVMSTSKGDPDEMKVYISLRNGQCLLKARTVFLGTTGTIQFYSGSVEIPDFFEAADERLLKKFSIDIDFSPSTDMLSWIEEYLTATALNSTSAENEVDIDKIQQTMIKMQQVLFREILRLKNKVQAQDKIIRTLQQK